MRLIDADSIHIDITGGRMNGKVEFAKAIEEAIKDAPIIEAIPVEWIEEWYRKKVDKPFDASDVSVRLLLRGWREEQC